ncbi:MAG: hypothetical protein QM703_18390 [Gemmatales bacterium]
MKAFIGISVFALLVGSVHGDDKPPVKTNMIKTTIEALALEFKEEPNKAVVKYSGVTFKDEVHIPLIDFSGAMTGFEDKQFNMVTGTSIKVVIQYDAFDGERPKSYILSGVARFKKFQNDTVYLVATDVKFGIK